MPPEPHKDKTKSASKHSPQKPWRRSVEEVADELNVQVKNGLSAGEVKQRRKRYGSNRLKETKRRSGWAILIDQVKSLIVLLLVVAAALSFFFGQWLEGISIVIAILLNGAIGFVTEQIGRAHV